MTFSVVIVLECTVFSSLVSLVNLSGRCVQTYGQFSMWWSVHLECFVVHTLLYCAIMEVYHYQAGLSVGGGGAGEQQV